MWASGVFKVKTADGTIVLENLPADAEVLVDGAKVIVKWGDGRKTAQISVAPGRHKIAATKDGVTVIGEEVEIKDGDRRVLTATRPRRPDPTKSGGAADDKGWVQLFNGKNLTGWKTHPNQPGNWRVEKGILIGSGRADSYLYTERGDYKDFHLLVGAASTAAATAACASAPHSALSFDTSR
jgi:hypothetical protein